MIWLICHHSIEPSGDLPGNSKVASRLIHMDVPLRQEFDLLSKKTADRSLSLWRENLGLLEDLPAKANPNVLLEFVPWPSSSHLREGTCKDMQ